MPMKMGAHCKLIGHSHSASLDSRVRRNDGGLGTGRGYVLSQKTPNNALS